MTQEGLEKQASEYRTALFLNLVISHKGHKAHSPRYVLLFLYQI